MNNQANKSKEQLIKEIERLNDKIIGFEKSDNLFHRLYNNSPDMYVSVSPTDAKIIECNETLITKTGYSKEEIIGYPIFKMYHEDCMDEVKVTFKQFVEKGIIENKELILKRKDGSKIDVSLNVNSIKDENGKTLHSISSWRDITNRKKIENDLIHSHVFMSYVINHNQSAVAVHDKDLNYLFVSQRYLNDYKVKEKDVIGKHHYDVFPDLPQKWRDVHQKALNGKISSADNDPYVREDGSIEWTRWECRPWYESDDSIGGIIVYTEVITERKQTEIEIKEKSEFIDKIIDSSALSTWISDENGTAIRTNPACLEFFGATEDEVIGKYNLFQDAVIEKQGFMPEIKKVFEKGEIAKIIIDYNFGEVEHVKVKNATHKIVNSIFTPILDNNGKVSNVIVQAIDLSEIKNAERIAIEEKNKAQQYLDIAEVILVSIDSDWNVQLINPKGCEVLGYTEDEIIGKNWFDTFIPERMRKDVKVVAKKIFAGEMESAKYYENEILTKSGEERIIAWNNAVLKDENGNIIGTLSSGEDITERKLAEEEILQSKILLESSIESPKDMIILSLDREYRYLYFNKKHMDAMSHVYGTQIQKGDCIFDHMTRNDDIEIVKSHYDRAMKGEGHVAIDEYGEETARFYYETQFNAIYNQNNEVIGVTAFAQNITVRKQAEIELQNKNVYIESIMSNMPIGFGINNIDDGEVKYLNKQFEEIYGWSKEILTNTSVFFEKVFPDPEYREKMMAQIISDMESGDPERMIWDNLKIVTSTGEERIVKAYNIPLIDQNIMISTVQDVTELKLAENELKKHHDHLEEIVKTRTQQLEEKNKELDNALKVFVGRELTIRDLQRQLNEIKNSK